MVDRLITPFPIIMPLKLIGETASKLYLSISTAKSGMYFPAYDSPARKKGDFLYYGYFWKKSSKAFRLSIAVFESL